MIFGITYFAHEMDAAWDRRMAIEMELAGMGVDGEALAEDSARLRNRVKLAKEVTGKDRVPSEQLMSVIDRNADDVLRVARDQLKKAALFKVKVTHHDRLIARLRLLGIMMAGTVGFGLVMCWYGFSRWYTCVQKPQDIALVRGLAKDS